MKERSTDEPVLDTRQAGSHVQGRGRSVDDPVGRLLDLQLEVPERLQVEDAVAVWAGALEDREPAVEDLADQISHSQKQCNSEASPRVHKPTGFSVDLEASHRGL